MQFGFNTFLLKILMNQLMLLLSVVWLMDQERLEVSVGLTGGSPNLLYIDGKTYSKVDNESLVDTLEMQIRRQIPISNV